MSYRKIMLAALAGAAISAHAESSLADSSKVHDIDEVVIVSQPKEVFRLRNQPLSSTSVGSFEIQKLGIHDLRDLSQYVPNFVMPNYGSRLSSAMYVRGIGSRVNSPAVGIYMDGFPIMSKSAFNLHNFQLSRVDVLRGPQGTLYGQNSEGGLVKLYSRDPFQYTGTDIKLSFGSRYYRNAEAAHYQKFNDHTALSLAAFYSGQKGFFRNTTTGDRADQYDEAGGKILLKTLLGKGWSLDVLANYQYVDQNGFPYGKMNPETGNTEQPSSTFPGTYRRNNLISGLNIGYKGKGLDFASVTSYQYMNDHMKMDQDYMPGEYMHLVQGQWQNSVTEELSLKSNRPVSRFWHWTVGTFFSKEWLKTDCPVYFDKDMTTPIANAIQSQMYSAMVQAMAKKMMAQGMTEDAATRMAEATIQKAGGVSLGVDMMAPGTYHTPQTNLGIYHESNFDITPWLTATLGLRYDFMHTKISYNSEAYMAMTASVMGQNATYTLRSVAEHEAKTDYNQFLPKFGLTYKVDNAGSNIYATISKGYRAGGYNIQMFSDILQSDLNTNRTNAMRGDYDVPHDETFYEKVDNTIAYQPETSWNYEAGAHLNLLGNSLHIDLSAFYMQVRNQQLSVMAGNYGFGRMMVNAGKSHSCGIEAALRGQILNGNLDWSATYGYTHAVFDEYLDSEGENAVDYKGKYVPYVPQHTLSATADYHVHFTGCGLHAITIGANVNAQGKTYWNNANSYAQKMYAVLGAHVDADFGIFQLSLWGKNLTDTRYNTFAIDSSATGTTEYFAQRGNPFQCGVDLRLHF